MILKVDKYFGLSLCNTIRQAALTGIKCIRPIGFRVGYNSTVIETSDSVEEDMTEFISNVSNGIFACNDDGVEVHECKVTVDGTLWLKDVVSSTPRLILISQNEDVLHTLASESVFVYFRLGIGCYSVDENTEFLASHGFDTDKLVVVSSRHSYVKTCTYKVIEEDESTLTVEFSIDMLDEADGDSILEEAISLVESSVTKLK